MAKINQMRGKCGTLAAALCLALIFAVMVSCVPISSAAENDILPARLAYHGGFNPKQKISEAADSIDGIASAAKTAKIKKTLPKISKNLRNALEKSLWETDYFLTEKGAKVFSIEIDAIKSMKKIASEKNSDRAVNEDVSKIKEILLNASRTIAAISLREARMKYNAAYEKKSFSIEKAINKSIDEFNEAGKKSDETVSAGLYAKSWKQSSAANKLIEKAILKNKKERPEPICGNGIVEMPEECDDGNGNNMDGCSVCRTSESIVNTNTIGVQDMPSV